MTSATTWPPRTRDTDSVIAAYDRVMGWPLIVHNTFVSPDRAAAELADDPGVVLSTPCCGFDAVSVPPAVGLDALVLAGRRGLESPPCLVIPDQLVVFLVRPGSADHLLRLGSVCVESGPGGRLVLPPAGGARWDTPPWRTREEARCQLLDGADFAACVTDAFRFAPAESPLEVHSATRPRSSQSELEQRGLAMSLSCGAPGPAAVPIGGLPAGGVGP